MSGPFIFSRRRFLQTAGGFSALSLAASMDKLGLASAAASVGDYKALVCVFLFGGNDSSNMVMPSTNYAQYLAARPLSCGINIPNVGSPPNTIAAAGNTMGPMLAINPANVPGAVFGLHPAMPEIQKPLHRGQVRHPLQRRQFVRADHPRAVHRVEARRQAGPRQPVLAQ